MTASAQVRSGVDLELRWRATLFATWERGGEGRGREGGRGRGRGGNLGVVLGVSFFPAVLATVKAEPCSPCCRSQARSVHGCVSRVLARDRARTSAPLRPRARYAG